MFIKDIFIIVIIDVINDAYHDCGLSGDKRAPAATW
jgi:hypothetical protein